MDINKLVVTARAVMAVAVVGGGLLAASPSKAFQRGFLLVSRTNSGCTSGPNVVYYGEMYAFRSNATLTCGFGTMGNSATGICNDLVSGANISTKQQAVAGEMSSTTGVVSRLCTGSIVNWGPTASTCTFTPATSASCPAGQSIQVSAWGNTH